MVEDEEEAEDLEDDDPMLFPFPFLASLVVDEKDGLVYLLAGTLVERRGGRGIALEKRTPAELATSPPRFARFT